MVDTRTQVLVATVKKLLNRGAEKNIRTILDRSRPADIAVMLEHFSESDCTEIFNLESSLEKKSKIFSFLEKKIQENLLSKLTQGEILKIISLLDPDDAASVLSRLSQEQSQEILASMAQQDSEDITDLMAYPEDSAGGLMTSDFFSLNQDLSVGEAIKEIQREGGDSKVTFYIYVVNSSGRLIGVISLKQLLLYKSSEILKDIMQPDIIFVDITANREEVVQIVERYDFLSVPVVDSNRTLTGVVTVDDIIDVIREEAEEDLLHMGRVGLDIKASIWEHFKARIFWQLLSFLGGSICLLLIAYSKNKISPPLDIYWILVSFIPLLFVMGTTTGRQTTTLIVGALRSGTPMSANLSYFSKEVRLGLVSSVLFSGFVLIISLLFKEIAPGSAIMALSMGLHILFCIFIGTIIPLILNKMGSDPTVASIPLFTIIADTSALFILYLSYIWLNSLSFISIFS